LLNQLGDQYVQVIETATQLRLPLERVESRMLLMNHADIMDKILHTWKFAKSLVNSIALHHLSLASLRSVAPRTVLPDATLALANRLAHALLLGCSGNEMIYAVDQFVKALKLSDADIEKIEKVVPDETHDLKYVMLQVSSEHDSVSMQKHWRSRLNGPFHPEVLSARPGSDVFRLLCNRLRSDSQVSSVPNVLVVHYHSVRDRNIITEQLNRIESQYDVCLPVLMISPKGNIILDERDLKDRPWQTLACPVHLQRFTDAVNYLISQ
ncbi:MAG: HDOD domain-containing protein, partial [Rhodospirillales bacterium]|nr:HDOD domain-containing protein [Rhodospirillales bacterium]